MIYNDEAYNACYDCGVVYVKLPENEYEVYFESPVFEKFSKRSLTEQDALNALSKAMVKNGTENTPVDVHEATLAMFFTDSKCGLVEDGIEFNDDIGKQVNDAFRYFAGHFLTDNYTFVENVVNKYNSSIDRVIQ